MSKKCLFERATGLFIGGTSFDDLPHDPTTHIQLTLPDYPDRRTERWDGSTGVRPAIAQEIADFDDAAKSVDVLSELVDALIARTGLTMTDFSADARTEITDRKARRR